VAQAVATLRDALMPSERELAAISLGQLDWRTNLPAVQALISAATEDPAGGVRAACVRSLVRMNANTTPVLVTLRALKSDSDPRVQLEVEQGLIALGVAPDNAAQGVLPAAAPAPAEPLP
jgi:hypothetical protein